MRIRSTATPYSQSEGVRRIPTCASPPAAIRTPGRSVQPNTRLSTARTVSGRSPVLRNEIHFVDGPEERLTGPNLTIFSLISAFGAELSLYTSGLSTAMPLTTIQSATGAPSTDSPISSSNVP